jgi:1,4-dihydroxy-2-naphthoate octaprenyltransferase
VRIGREKAVRYHFALLIVGVLCAVVFIGLRFENFWAYSFVLVLPLLFKNAKAVYEKTNPTELDPYLKQMALTTLLFVIVFGMGLLLG